MQPLQCVLQHDVANPHASTHMATPDDNNHAAIPMRSATTDSRNAENYAHRNNHSLQNTEEEPIELETIQTAPAAHTRYLSSPAEATLHGKTQGFVLRLPPQKKAHATFMQPLQCVLQHDVANPHASTHMATPDDNNHAAIPMRSATTDSKHSCNSMTWLTRMHRTTHTGTTTRCRTQRRNRLNSKRSKPHPPHTRGTFHRRLTQLYTEKHKVSCSGFLPKRKPMQHSCSHYNAFYSMTWLTRMHLRTWQHQMTTIMQPFQCDLQPQIQETHRTTHTGTTTGCRTQRRNRLNSKRSKPHPPHTRGTFHRRLTQLYTEKHKVSCSGSSPKESPCNIHAAITMRFTA